MVKATIGDQLANKAYVPKKVTGYCNDIIDSCLKDLQSLSRPYKYILTCILTQKNGAGLVSAASTYWDGAGGKDGVCKVSWENATMQCVVTVFGCSVNIDNAAELD